MKKAWVLLSLMVAGHGVCETTERFYGRESFTLAGTQSGMETGTFTEHVRDWGRKRVEIKNTTVSVMGITQQQNTRTVFDRSTIATVDATTGAVTLGTNPMYDKIVAAMQQQDGVEFGKTMMVQMGGRATGEKGRFAGQDCDYWELPQFQSRSCVTSWGATLYTRASMAGVTIERKVTELRLDDKGPDAAFAYDASKAQKMPDLRDIMKRMQGQ